MKRQNIAPGESVARGHQPTKQEDVPLSAFAHEQKGEYVAKVFAKSLLQRIYGDQSVGNISTKVIFFDTVDYANYKRADEAILFGEFHISRTSEKLPVVDVSDDRMLMSAKGTDTGVPLSMFLNDAQKKMRGFAPAGLHVLYEIMTNPEKYQAPESQLFEGKEGVLFPGVLVLNPMGKWCIPLVKLSGDGTPEVRLVALSEIIGEKDVLFISP